VAPIPERLRSGVHLAFVRLLRCTVCQASAPSDPHHLKHMQPRARGLRSGDQWTVPLCRLHHDAVEAASGHESAWWAAQGIDPAPLATELWARSEGRKRKPKLLQV